MKKLLQWIRSLLPGDEAPEPLTPEDERYVRERFAFHREAGSNPPTAACEVATELIQEAARHAEGGYDRHVEREVNMAHWVLHHLSKGTL